MTGTLINDIYTDLLYYWWKANNPIKHTYPAKKITWSIVPDKDGLQESKKE